MARVARWEWAIRGGALLLALAAFGVVVYAAFTESWKFETARRITVAPDTVFAYFTQPQLRVRWQPGLLDIARLTGDPGKAGATRMLFMGGDGRRWQEEETQLAVRPPSRWSVSRDGPTAEREIAVRLVPLPAGGVRLSWIERVSHKSLENRLLAPISIRDRRQRVADALDRLAEIAGQGVGRGGQTR